MKWLTIPTLLLCVLCFGNETQDAPKKELLTITVDNLVEFNEFAVTNIILKTKGTKTVKLSISSQEGHRGGGAIRVGSDDNRNSETIVEIALVVVIEKDSKYPYRLYHQMNERKGSQLVARSRGSISEFSIMNAETIQDLIRLSIPKDCSLEKQIELGRYIKGKILLTVSNKPIEN